MGLPAEGLAELLDASYANLSQGNSTLLFSLMPKGVVLLLLFLTDNNAR